MTNSNGKQILRETVFLLKKHPEGLTIKELSDMMGLHRQTITKYIMWLAGAGLIIRRKIGSATLLYLKKYSKKFVGDAEE